MHGRTTMIKRCGLLLPFFAGLVAIFGIAAITPAQGPIRVESRQVLVPTVVFDKKLYTLIDKKSPKHSLSYLFAHDPHFWDSIAIRTLTAKDFHLYEDGQEQGILSVALEAPIFSIVQDNLGEHPESIGTGGGRWTYPDLANAETSLWFPWPQYVIAYVPPPSPPDGCHQIRVDVGRRNLVVWSRSEYCNTPKPAADPLNGTEFGKQMEEDLMSGEPGKIDLKLQAVALYGVEETARVNIRLEFPWKSLRHEFKDETLNATIGSAGIIYDQDGSVAARFSDFACCDYGNSNKPSLTGQSPENHYDRDTSMIPNGYETEIDLPPGKYAIEVVISDGEKFGRQQVPLVVKRPDEKQISVSDVALCRRVRKIPPELQDVPAKMAGSYVPLVNEGVEYTPTANLSFKRNEMLYAYFEIFDPQNSAQATAKLKAQLIIVDARTGKLKIEFAPVDAARYVQAGSSVVRIARGIDLKSLQQGEYQLQVRATDSAGTSTEWHKATFVIQH
ncbi:MAG: hypothetical protein WAN72_00395 [Candidatus Acidiferrales bacterium]